MKKLKLLRACDVPLDEMTPVPGGHHCHHCDKMVFDLRRATYAEARALGRRTDGTPCIRYIPDENGFARFKPSTIAVGAALMATSALGCDAATRLFVDETIEHAAHRGEPHTERHTEEYGLAGVAPPEFFEEETPPEIETPPEDETPGEGEGEEAPADPEGQPAP